MKKVILLSLFTLVAIYICAAPQCRVTNITTNDGLSNNTVRAVFQDSKGYMWFCTPNGLSRYDGTSITVYRPSSSADNYMTDSKIRNIQEDNTGHLWIGNMSRCFDCYDITRHRFVPVVDDDGEPYHHDQIAFVNDTTWLWGNSTGCVFATFGKEKAKTVEIGKEFSPLASVYVNFVAKGGGFVWIGTENGLFCYDGKKVSEMQKKGDFIAHHSDKYGEAFLTKDGDVHMLKQGKHTFNIIKVVGRGRIYGTAKFGNLWLVYSANGTTAFNLQKSAFVAVPEQLNVSHTRRLIHDNKGNCWLTDDQCQLTYINDQRSLVKKFNLIPQGMLVQNYEFYSVHEGKNDMIWISTNGNGLFSYNIRNDQLIHYSSSDDSPVKLPSPILKHVYEDRSGSLWLGTALIGVIHMQLVNSTGIQTVNLSSENGGQYNQIRLLRVANDGQLLIGNRNGDLFKSGYKGTAIAPQLFRNVSGLAYCAYEDDRGQMWIGTKGNGIYVGERNYSHVTDDETSLSDDNVFDIMSDSKSRIWIATLGGGLNLVVRGAGNSIRFRHFFNSGNDKIVRRIITDLNGWMWMATSNGVIAFNPDHLVTDNSNYIRLSAENGKLSTNEIKTIFCDSNGRIWISEAGCGVAMCQPNGNYENIDVKHYSAVDGITNPMVQAFEEDNMGGIWISTESGITRLNPDNGNAFSYFFSADITANNFCENSSCKLDDGRLVFGTNNGALVITPSMVKTSETATAVHLTEAKANGVEIDARNVEADHDFNVLDLFFSTFDYSSIVPQLFMYKLDGCDDEWREPTRSNCFSIRDLSPGKYTLHVKAFTAQGSWSEELIVPITIHSSLWFRWWAVIIYLLLIGGLLYIIRKRYSHVVSLREHISAQDKKMNMMQNLFAEGVKKDANMDESEKELLEKIEQVAMSSIDDAEFTSEDFAEQLGLGHTTFYSTMKRLTGKSPKEYLRHIRMKEAARLLLTSNKNVSEIAYQVGFNEISYFSKCFKRHFGVSPQNYKRDQSDEKEAADQELTNPE